MTGLDRRECLKFMALGMASASGAGLGLMNPKPVQAANASMAQFESDLDSVIAPFMRDFDIPGLAIGIVHKNHPPFDALWGSQIGRS